MKVVKYIQGKEDCAVELYNLLAEFETSWRKKLSVKMHFLAEISATKSVKLTPSQKISSWRNIPPQTSNRCFLTSWRKFPPINVTQFSAPKFLGSIFRQYVFVLFFYISDKHCGGIFYFVANISANNFLRENSATK
jgi:hypothetical protein